jgi:hypothetical protein
MASEEGEGSGEHSKGANKDKDDQAEESKEIESNTTKPSYSGT